MFIIIVWDGRRVHRFISNNLSKLIWCPVGFVPRTFIWGSTLLCLICGRRRVAVILHRMICLVDIHSSSRATRVFVVIRLEERLIKIYHCVRRPVREIPISYTAGIPRTGPHITTQLVSFQIHADGIPQNKICNAWLIQFLILYSMMPLSRWMK